MRLEDLNALDAETAARELLRCCGSRRWAERMAGLRPFVSIEGMAGAADRVFETLDRADWLEAFAAHPKIGGGSPPPSRRSSHEPGASGGGRASAERGSDWSEQEQASIADAADATLRRLADANRDYEVRFGYIFIVCAMGKSAAEMLELLERRIDHDPAIELGVAADEQRKITRVRLVKLVDGKQDTTS
jgi:OHCU decarboxylase